MKEAKAMRNRRNTIPYGISSLNLTLGRKITDEEINETINEAGREIAGKSNKNSELLLSLLGSAKGIGEEFERSRKEDESCY